MITLTFFSKWWSELGGLMKQPPPLNWGFGWGFFVLRGVTWKITAAEFGQSSGAAPVWLGLNVKAIRFSWLFWCLSSGGGQTDAGTGRRRDRPRLRAPARSVRARSTNRPKPAAPDVVHARAAVPPGAGVRQGELRLPASALRAGYGAEPAGDHHKGGEGGGGWTAGLTV